jgi:4-oxalocrotonate tautomerase
MPIIEVHLVEGRTSEQKAAMAEAVTDAVVRSLGARADAVRILVTEHRPDGFYVAGQTMAQRAAKQHAIVQEQSS